MSRNIGELHAALERAAPDGVGVAISLGWLEEEARRGVAHLFSTARPGITSNLPLPSIREFQAAFTIPANGLRLDASTGTLTLDFEVWIHAARNSSQEIVRFYYHLESHIGATVDQNTFDLFLAPDRPNLTEDSAQRTYGPFADTHLINAGYVLPDGTADRARFEQVVVMPFVWLNGAGLTASIFRSLPVPQLLSKLCVMRPVAPVSAEVRGAFLVAWADRATLAFPSCGQTRPPLRPEPATLTASSALAESPHDGAVPRFALYFGGQSLLDWHSDALSPAVKVPHSSEGLVGWSCDITFGLRQLNVKLQPAPDGGTIVSDATLWVTGTMNAWLNGPCGLRLDLITRGVSSDGALDSKFQSAWDRIGREMRGSLEVNGRVSRQFNADRSGLLGTVIADIIDFLVSIGAIELKNKYQRHSDTPLLEAATISAEHWIPALRVGQRSALISAFREERGMRQEKSGK